MPPAADNQHSRMETAELLGIHYKTLDRLRNEKKIGHLKVGRRILFMDSQIRAYQDANRIDPDDDVAV